MSNVEVHPSLTQVTCPYCGRNLRLTGINPAPRRRAVMHFACACGADYQMLPSLGDDDPRQSPQAGDPHDAAGVPPVRTRWAEAARAILTPNPKEQRG